MIGRLRGEVIERGAGEVVVDVGGVGYVVIVSAGLVARVGDRVDLYVHTAVREDAITLFGFASREERALFHLLLSVPGVGPVKAMGMLQTPVVAFVEMVARREAAKLARLPGVGKKTAERILVDLGDKIAALGPVPAGEPGRAATLSAPAAPPSALSPPVLADLVSALVNLGFKDSVALETARASLVELGEAASLEALLRDALARSRPKL